MFEWTGGGAAAPGPAATAPATGGAPAANDWGGTADHRQKWLW